MVPKTRLKPTFILTGPTASGKSSLAYELARSKKNIEIINADSIQIYEQFDIGSAKPSKKELREIPHHLINVMTPEGTFTAADFVKRVTETITEIRSREKIPLVVGGTGFYLKALLYGMWDAPPTQLKIRERLETESTPELFEKLKSKDPTLAQKVTLGDRYRLIRALEIIESSGKLPSELEKQTSKNPDPSFRLFLIDRETKELHERIETRAKLMLAQGWIDEVKSILEKTPHASALKSVGYKQVVDYLNSKKPSGRNIKPGEVGLLSEIALATRQLVKRQRTWFRGQTEGEWFILDRDLERLKLELESIE